MMKKKAAGRLGICMAAILLMPAGFELGVLGMERYAQQRKLSKEEDAISLEIQEQNNSILLTGMQCVSVERELYIQGAKGTVEARISNAPESTLLASFTIFQEKEGILLYESGVIGPGHYIEMIQMEEELVGGSYACTGIWKFYDLETEEYRGEAAVKLTVIVMDRGE